MVEKDDKCQFIMALKIIISLQSHHPLLHKCHKVDSSFILRSNHICPILTTADAELVLVVLGSNILLLCLRLKNVDV